MTPEQLVTNLAFMEKVALRLPGGLRGAEFLLAQHPRVLERMFARPGAAELLKAMREGPEFLARRSDMGLRRQWRFAQTLGPNAGAVSALRERVRRLPNVTPALWNRALGKERELLLRLLTNPKQYGAFSELRSFLPAAQRAETDLYPVAKRMGLVPMVGRLPPRPRFQPR